MFLHTVCSFTTHEASTGFTSSFHLVASKTRSRVGKSPWVFRLSLCLVDFTAMVFRHVLLAASFFGTAGNELGQQILASSTLKFAFFGKW